MTGESEFGVTWALVVMFVLPIVIIAVAELDERLRQRESLLRAAVSQVRIWVLPLFAIWALLRPVLGVDQTNAGSRLISSGLLIAVVAAVLAVLRVIVDQINDRPRLTGRPPVPQLLLALPRLGILLLAAWTLVGSIWGVDLSSAMAALGVTSLVVSFALQDTLSGLASGVLLLSDQPFHTGDWIEAGDVKGEVLDINWRTSRIRNRNGDVITVPNSTLAGANIVNFSAPTPLHRVVVPVQVAFKNPPTLAKAMLLDAARGVDGVVSEPPPNVRIVAIDDPLMSYEVDMWVTDYAIEPRVRSEFGALVWYQSHRHNVPLPSPAQDLFLWDGVANEAAGEPSLGFLRSLLEQAPMLASLPDAELDQLATATTPARFRVGETIADTDTASREVVVVIEGEARLIVHDDAEHVITELAVGELFDLASSVPPGDQRVTLDAATDCEVLLLDPDVISEVGSRNATVADAFNRSSTIRRRRIDRFVTQRQLDSSESSDS